MAKSFKFESQQNKGMLWDLLYKDSAFEGIPPDKINTVRALFEQTIYNKSKSIPHGTIMERNKAVIAEMVHSLRMLAKETGKTIHAELPDEALRQTSQQTYVNNPQGEKETRPSIFQNKVNKQREEFEKLIHPPKPTPPSFSEGIDQPIGKEMDALVENMIASREIQTKTALESHQDPKLTKQWLKQGRNSIQNTSQPNAPPIAPPISIGGDIDLQDNIVYIPPLHPKQKRVSFSDKDVDIPQASSKPNTIDVSLELKEIRMRLDNLEKLNRSKQATLSPYV